MIPYSKPKLSDLYTISQSQLLDNDTFTAAHTYIGHIWQYPLSPAGEKSFAGAHQI